MLSLILVCVIMQMVSLANEVQQYHLAKKEDVTSFSKTPLICGLIQEPSLYDTVSYSYCYIGLLTGERSLMFLITLSGSFYISPLENYMYRLYTFTQVFVCYFKLIL